MIKIASITHLVCTSLNFTRGLGALVVIVLFGVSVSHAQILVTAVRDGAGDLKLISWDQNGTRLNGDGAQAGKVFAISAVRLGSSNQIVTAVRAGALQLKVIVWLVSANGQIERRQSADGEAAEIIATASNPNGDRLITAVRDGGGKLRVILWAVTPEGEIIRLGHGPIVHGQPEPAHTTISATFVGPSGTLLATAMRDSHLSLKIITWRITTFGCVTKLHEISAGRISEVSMIAAQDGSRLVTAVRDGDENLKLIAWNVDQDGRIVRAQEAQAGSASRIAAFPLFGSRLATAVRDGNDDLKVIAWDASPTNSTIERVAEIGAREVSVIAGCATGVAPSAPAVVRFQTSVRDGSGHLKIIPWRWNPSTSLITRFSQGEASAGDVDAISTVCFDQF